MAAPLIRPDWLSITAYSRQYGADRKTVHKWLNAGLLESYRVGRFIRVQNRAPKDLCDTKPVKREDSPFRTKVDQTGQ